VGNLVKLGGKEPIQSPEPRTNERNTVRNKVGTVPKKNRKKKKRIQEEGQQTNKRKEEREEVSVVGKGGVRSSK